MAKQRIGTLIIVGGGEDKREEQTILKEVSARAGKGKLVVATAATTLPEEVAEEYIRIFKKLGVENVEHLDIRARHDAYHESNIEILRGASVVFFTGGDQLRITANLGDSPIYSLLQDIYHDGGTIVGTSAGASVMSETMMVSGPQDESNTIGSLSMAPGFALLRGVLIDQHFAERGRIGRLIGAVAHNPRNLGVGIDQNTAIIVDTPNAFRVIGEGAVYVVDGTGISDTNLADGRRNETVSVYDI